MWIGTALLLVAAAAMPAPAAQDKPDANGKAAPAAERKKTAAAQEKKNAPPPQGKSTTSSPKRVTEADGKTYEIRDTPFGPMKFPVKTQDPAREASADAFLSVVEEGDSLRFRRQTPFGVNEWVRKKSELNDTEKRVWERELRKSTSSAPVETKEAK
jgi:hypothetical protein